MKNLAKLDAALTAIENDIKQAKAECGKVEDRLPHSNVYMLGLLAAMEGAARTARDFLLSASKAKKQPQQPQDSEEQ